jgi:hypothetical protein
MSEGVDIPIPLNVRVEPAINLQSVKIEEPIHLQAVQMGLEVGPQGLPGPSGDTLWEADTLTTIKPKDAKQVNAEHLTGVIFGGLFQP